ncbi:MAG: MmcQ/YjbR family DNA-binding protein [Rikenellaceae bacterium]|jgi:predicted DNA-binding protein (MmcQ/YjbR family)|nr:MmcQ/YjbR family DNA-binding protein [Rikenellaceae bacterium]
MDIEQVREYCLAKAGSAECFPFDDVSLVVKVLGKMFALIPLDADEPQIALKCDPELAVELRERYDGMEGAYHFNKKYWNTVRLEADVPDGVIRELIDHSYDEVVRKLPRKTREEYFG